MAIMTCSDLTMELLFTLTQVICDMATLLRWKSTTKRVDQQPADGPADNTVGTTGDNCTTCVVCETSLIGPPVGLAIII